MLVMILYLLSADFFASFDLPSVAKFSLNISSQSGSFLSLPVYGTLMVVVASCPSRSNVKLYFFPSSVKSNRNPTLLML